MTTSTCPNCGVPYAQHETTCAKCGLVFGSQPTIPLALRCPACGQPQRVRAQNCSQCGTSLSVRYRPLQAGEVLDNGNYVVVRPLSYGGMGTIYLATNQRAFQRIVVIKAMLGYFNQHNPREVQEAHQRFEQEARTLARLKHDAIPEIYKFFPHGPHHYIVMEHIDGEDLEQGLTSYDDAGKPVRHGQPYDEKDVIRWGIALCNVLEYLSSQQPHPVVHQDIKPANLILDNNEIIHLVDFGTAQAHSLGTSGNVQSRPAMFGTFGYAPPEQHHGQTEPRSDIYALSATLYHLATNDDPRVHLGSFPAISHLGKFGKILTTCLSQDVAKRPTAHTLRLQLEKLLAPTQRTRSQPIQAPDGAVIADISELAAWCEQHWTEAGAWLHQRETLAGQIAKL